MFEFPANLRPYDWTGDQAHALLDDLLWACEEAGNDADPSPFYIGTLVLAESTKRSVRVFDGRQRLTTLSIIFAVLRDLEGDMLQRRLLDKCLRDDAVSEEGAGFRLRPKGSEAEILARWVFHDGATERSPGTDEKISSRLEQITRITRSFRARLAWVEGRARERLICVLQRCEVIVIVTDANPFSARH